MRESLTYETGLREECVVFGMSDLEGGDVARDMYYGLSALQHRGQESCGIAVCDTNGPKGVVNCYKGLGLVNEVFHEETLKRPAAIWELVMSATHNWFFYHRKHTATGT